jgi:hypothetical protein
VKTIKYGVARIGFIGVSALGGCLSKDRNLLFV